MKIPTINEGNAKMILGNSDNFSSLKWFVKTCTSGQSGKNNENSDHKKVMNYG